MPRASSAPIVPERRRRCRRVASAGLSSALTASRPSGATTIVSSPLRTTTAPAALAASRARASRWAVTSLGLASEQPAELAGVRRQHGRRPTARERRRGRSRAALRPSASISSGAAIAAARSRTSSAASSARPSPGPRTTQAERSPAEDRRGRAPRRARRRLGEADRHHLGQLRPRGSARGSPGTATVA